MTRVFTLLSPSLASTYLQGIHAVSLFYVHAALTSILTLTQHAILQFNTALTGR